MAVYGSVSLRQGMSRLRVCWVCMVVSGGSRVLFSQYLENGGHNVAVELYNPSDFVVDLSGWQLWIATDGRRWPAAQPSDEEAVLRCGISDRPCDLPP